MPEGLRYPLASESELRAFEVVHGAIPADFRWFLAECGGGVVGSEWVDGIAQLSQTHRKFEAESSLAHGWTLKDVFVIGWDGSGNPIGIHRNSGKVLVEDHNGGGIEEWAPSFESFLKSKLLDESR